MYPLVLSPFLLILPQISYLPGNKLQLFMAPGYSGSTVGSMISAMTGIRVLTWAFCSSVPMRSARAVMRGGCSRLHLSISEVTTVNWLMHEVLSYLTAQSTVIL